MFRKLRTTLLVFIFILTISSFGFAQSAQVQGRVSDASGAVVQKASVRVEDQKTGAVRMTETNESGQYAVPGLIPSIYKIFVQANGFSGAISDPFTLNVAQNAVLDFKLQVGAGTQDVVVNAADLEMNTTDASVSTIIDRQFAENLPLNGRSFQSLLYLTPGVSVNTSGVSSGWAEGLFTINGQRGSSNYWTVDGVSANIGVQVGDRQGNGASGAVAAVNVLGGTSGLVSVDALQEFRIQTATYAPEFGRTPGGQISILTRSGTNKFHGEVFDYFRNDVLDANNWFNGYLNNPALPKPEERQNDFGGVLGGPIVKDRAFFFFSYEGLRLRLPQTVYTTVPTLAAREAAIPAVQPFINAYPLPDPGAPEVPGSPGLAPFNASFSNPSSVDAYSIRLDHTLSQKLNIFGRYNYSPSSSATRAAGLTANTIGSLNLNTMTFTVGATWAQSSERVNDVRFNYSSFGGKLIDHMDTFGGGSVPPASSLFPSQFTYNNGLFALYPYFGTNMPFYEGLAARNQQNQYNLVDTLSIQKGTHSLKFGIDYRQLAPEFNREPYYLIAFIDSLSGLQSGVTDTTSADNIADVTFLFHNLSAFGQDTWRVNQRLTMTYGLRWDVDFVPTTKNGPAMPAVTGFSYGADLSNLALAPTGTKVWNTTYGNVAPRLGITYQLSQTPNWSRVMRAGFGVFYDLSSSEVGNFNTLTYPYQVLSNIVGAPFPTTPADAAQPARIPPDATQGILSAFDPHMRAPYILEWSAALEQALGKAQTFTASYIGSSGSRLLAASLLSNPNSSFATADLIGNAGSSSYNALQLQFQRRLVNGLQAVASYTWAHSIDTGSYGFYFDGSLADVDMNRASSDFDIRHNFSGAVTYNVASPFKSNLGTLLLGGWSTENIFQLASAPPVEILDGAFTALLAESQAAVNVRPDVVLGQPLYVHGSKYPGKKALNPDAFENPPVDPTTGLPTRQGTLGRNDLRAFGLTQWDFAVHREFALREALKLQFRAEMFNVLNHPNFAPYNSTFGTGDPYFGQSTSTQNQSTVGQDPGRGGVSALYQVGGPRSIQLAMKLMF